MEMIKEMDEESCFVEMKKKQIDEEPLRRCS